MWCLCGFPLGEYFRISNQKRSFPSSKQVRNNFPIRIPNSYPPPERLYRLSNSPHRACGHLVWQLMDSTPGNYCHRTFSPGGRPIQYSRVVLSARTCSRYNIRALAHSSITIVSGRYLCILTGGGKGKSHRHLVEQRVTAVDIIRLVAIVVDSGIATLKQIRSGVPQLVGF